jgi:hypothetical protein
LARRRFACNAAYDVELTPRDFRAHLLPILLGQFVGLTFGVVGVRLASHWVAPADYGIYGLFISIAPLGLGVVHAGLLKFVARHWAGTADQAGLRHFIVRAVWRKTPWLALASSVVAACLPAPWWLTFPVLFMTATALTLQSLVQTALQAERANWRDFGIGLIASALRTLLPLLLYVSVAAHLGMLLGGFTLHAMLAAVAAWFIGGWQRNDPRRSLDNPVASASYDGPRFMTLAVAGWVMGASGRWVVALFFGMEEAGYFALAGNIALVVVSVLYAVVQQFVQPRLFALASTKTATPMHLAHITDAVSLGFTVIGIAGLLACSALAPLLVGSFIGPHYASAIRWLMPAGCYHLALLGPTFSHLLLLATKRERACGPPELSAAVVILVGALGTAAFGVETFRWFAVLSPVIPWLTTRPLTQRALAKTESVDHPASQAEASI